MIRLWDRGPHVAEWRRVMNSRFGGLYTRLHGPLPTDTDVYGPRAAEWQTEYQIRTGQRPTGEVSDGDMYGLGISTAPVGRGVLFTVHGTGMADPFGPGLPADTARDVLDRYEWQPIGDYPAATFPMKPSIDLGVKSLVFQINRYPGREINLAGYSQGAVVTSWVLKHEIMSPEGSLHHRLKDVRKVVAWGNPMRQQGIMAFDHWKYPMAGKDSHGIMEDRLEGLETAPFQVRDYAHEGDMYACIRDRDADEYKAMIQKIVFSATDFFGGPDSVVAQLREFTERPLSEGIAAATAAIEALKFFVNLDQHNYNRYPAVDFLRS